MKTIPAIDRRRLARELVIGAPVAALAWLLILFLVTGGWSFGFPLVILGFSGVLALLMIGPEMPGSGAYHLWKGLVFLIDWVVTRLVCLVLYYGIFTPVGWLLRLFGVSLVDRKLYPERRSYWIKCSPADDGKRHYFRQY